MLLFYIRHGDPIYHPDSLTPLGLRQAESVAKRLALYGIDEVYSSSSIRAQLTAQPTSEITKNPIKLLEWMHEDNASKNLMYQFDEKKKMWCWAHPKYSQILTSREVREMGENWYDHPAFAERPIKQTFATVGEELDKWLASFGLEHDREKGMYKVTSPEAKNKRIALFAHEGMGKIFMSHLLDTPFPYYSTHFEMKPTGVTVISFDEGMKEYPLDGYARARMLTLSNDSHLYRDGLPTFHQSASLRERY